MTSVRLTVLGSGTLIPDDDRRSAAHLIEGDGFRLLLDCGAGTVHGFDRHGVAWRGLTHLALSHFHTDHVGDVAPLLFALEHGVRPAREATLTLIGPPGVRDFLDALAGAHGDYVVEPGFPLEVVETARSGSWEAPGLFRLRTHPTRHTERSVCFRVETDAGVVGYTGDTGEDDAVADFLAGCDVLVAECSLPDPPEVDTHLTPRGVARLARRASPRLLLLTHLYPTLEVRRVPDLVAEAGYTGPTMVAGDGDGAVVTAGAPPRLFRAG